MFLKCQKMLLTFMLGYKALLWHTNMVLPDLSGKSSLIHRTGVHHLCSYKNAQCSRGSERCPLRDLVFSGI